jgi:hypothetical protein
MDGYYSYGYLAVVQFCNSYYYFRKLSDKSKMAAIIATGTWLWFSFVLPVHFTQLKICSQCRHILNIRKILFNLTNKKNLKYGRAVNLFMRYQLQHIPVWGKKYRNLTNDLT